MPPENFIKETQGLAEGLEIILSPQLNLLVRSFICSGARRMFPVPSMPVQMSVGRCVSLKDEVDLANGAKMPPTHEGASALRSGTPGFRQHGPLKLSCGEQGL